MPTSLLFLHPVALDGRAAAFGGLGEATAPAFPGHGPRERRAGARLDDMVDEIAGWLPEPAHVVGCSMGGMIAQRLALRHPQLVRSLLLGFTTARVPEDVMRDRAAAWERGPQAVLEQETMARWFTEEALGAPEPASGVAYARERLRATDRSAIADAWRAIADHDVLDELGAVSVPTTCLAGSVDLSAPPSAVEAIAEAIPGARFVVMEGPHMAFLETPGAFRTIVDEHLIGVGAR